MEKRFHNPHQIRRMLEGHSPYWKQQMEAHPADLQWLLGTKPFERARTLRRMEAEWMEKKWESLDVSQTFAALREAKRHEMLRITLRELAGLTALEETVAELSALADFCLQRALPPCLETARKRYGKPSAEFAVFGMGKLGGEELNYSSDIDLIFVYSEEGNVGKVTHHVFFTEAAKRLVEGIRSAGEEGSLYRVDLRLRPEGDAGPLTRSLESYENYYAAFGDVWERMALQKARLVAGDAELGYEFIQRLQPFCFPKHLEPSAFEGILHIKSRIENEILREGGLERNIKLGRGGIREIEFSVQALQLLQAARHPFMQERGTMKTLQALRRLEILSPADAAALSSAYIFFRRLEHRLQMRENQQTHTVPNDPTLQAEIAKGLGFKTLKAFQTVWKGHVDFVEAFFRGVVGKAPKGEKSKIDEDQADPLGMEKLGFKNQEKAGEILKSLARGPEYAHVSQRTRELFQRLRPLLLEKIQGLLSPDRVILLLERLIEAYGPRGALYEMLLTNPKLLELLFRLFDHSRELAEILIAQPVLLESIAFEGILDLKKSLRELRIQLDREEGESPGQRLWSFKNAELLRIALRDILGLAKSTDETREELTLLADVCLNDSLRAPHSALRAPMCVIGLGKYGSRELSYGSDLDVLFVGGTEEEAAKIIGTLEGEGKGKGAFKMDLRLRPDGEKGPLTLPLEAYARYYQKRAQFWELQALTRARVAAGNQKMGESFLKMAGKLIYSRSLSEKELNEMIAMFRRIETERGDPADPARDFKTGAGGLVEVEFLAQAQQLKLGWKFPSLRGASTVAVLRAMPNLAGWKKEEGDQLIEDYDWLRKLEGLLRLDHFAPVSQLPGNREEWKTIARRMGFDGMVSFETDLNDRRRRVRRLARHLMRP